MLPRLHAHVITTPTGRDARVMVYRGHDQLFADEIDDETLEDFGWTGHGQRDEDQADALLGAALDVLDNRWEIPPDPYVSLLEYDTDPEGGHPAVHIITTVAGAEDPVWTP